MSGFRANDHAPRPIGPMIRERDEATPMEPLYHVGELVERARIHLMEAAKVADAADLPRIHAEVTDTRDRVMRCQSELASWTGGRGK